MKFKNYVLIALVALSLNTRAAEPEEDFKAAFLAVFDSMKTNFSFLDDATPDLVGEHKRFYKVPNWSFPRMKTVSVIEDINSKQRVFRIVLDLDLTNAEDRRVFDDIQIVIFNSFKYWVQAYKYNKAADQTVSFVKDRMNDNAFVGGFTVGAEKNNAIIKFYPFSGDRFFADLKKVMNAGIETNFATYKGENNKGGVERWESTCNFYQADYSIYGERFSFSEDNFYMHDVYYSGLPSQMIVQLFGRDEGVIKKALGSDFRVVSFDKKDEGDNNFSTKIKLVSGERTLVVWTDVAQGTQVVGLVMEGL